MTDVFHPSTDLAPSASHGHEQVVFCQDRQSGLRAIIAIYSTALGPALGGTRFYPYPDEDTALADVLNLSRAMAYKNALAGLDHGGGKAVIIGDPATHKSEALLRAYGRFIESLGGRYITACDIGTYSEDMDIIARESGHVTGRTVPNGGAGDSSVLTAFGVFQGMRAAAEHRWGSPSLEGRVVGVEGVGKVGRRLVTLLAEAGASAVISDVDPGAVSRVVAAHPGVRVAASRAELLTHDIDVYAPCALGGALDDDTVTGPAGRRRLRRGEQPAGSPRHRETARRPRRPVRPGLPGQRGRRDPGLRRAAAGSTSSGPRPGRRRSTARPGRSSPSPTPRACRRRSRPTGWPSAGCPRWAGSGGSGWVGEVLRRPPVRQELMGVNQSCSHPAEALTAQSRYGWICTQAGSASHLKRWSGDGPSCMRKAASHQRREQEPESGSACSRGSSQWGAAEPRPSR